MLQEVDGSNFSRRVLRWFRAHGRTDLPWQSDPTPYRVWVSEVMLQQTQVTAVIPYFLDFMAEFPGVRELADAGLDRVLHRWSGLGYYARARNLHRAARLIRDEHRGHFPDSFAAVRELPGVGRSTAGAIMAIAYGRRFPILDGNVKRVLARWLAIDEWPGRTAVLNRLWEAADACTPAHDVAAYTQAIMDLGATVCRRGTPHCDRCPLAGDCRALLSGRASELPVPRPRRVLPVRSTTMLLLRNARGEVLLERRPPAGIWGGLWSLPELEDASGLSSWCRAQLGVEVAGAEAWKPVRHTFTHFHLDISPLLADIKNPGSSVMEAGGRVWYKTGSPDRLGLAAPVKRLLDRLAEQ